MGCNAGFLTVAKLKGVNNAIRSGALAAEAAVEAIEKQESSETKGMRRNLQPRVWVPGAKIYCNIYVCWVYVTPDRVQKSRKNWGGGRGGRGRVIKMK